ncbi:MAG: Peptidase propeptide and domain [Capsulimonas sp.]|jgi:uncharacterized membrane protein YkoI|nr:Peptidase propeptide and domain [Capsulimonas sp.]
MKNSKIVCQVIAVAAMAAAGHSAAHAAAPKPKITPAQAEAAAVKKIPGKAVSAKYEFEDGRWQYAVLVKGKTGMYEVEVSSSTGKVLDQEKTSAAEESKEAAADKAAAAKHPAK